MQSRIKGLEIPNRIYEMRSVLDGIRISGIKSSSGNKRTKKLPRSSAQNRHHERRSDITVAPQKEEKPKTRERKAKLKGTEAAEKVAAQPVRAIGPRVKGEEGTAGEDEGYPTEEDGGEGEGRRRNGGKGLEWSGGSGGRKYG
ncbi:hypothetical protein PIB30_074395 [Stylosanthes scabra]|uniref:Uncharacterized protein n=1 Tax=Stylosanthes scabra TaxID=79078 RepID=A0ABU6ZNE2_9FABA|nr:hypothetical protein [Stylosanthes scabra]